MSVRVPQRILVAPSGFKESLDAVSVATAIAAGVRRTLPGVRVDIAPIADGGEGTARILAAAGNGRLHELTVCGPTGEPVQSHWAEVGVGRNRIGVVEIARLLRHGCDVLLLDEPTRGIDVAAKAAIYATLRRLADEGKAILFVSSYLPELFGVCDRIAVMAGGRLGPARPARERDAAEIMREAIGAAA